MSCTSGSASTPGPSDHNPFLPTHEAQRMMGAYPESDVARASLVQMNEISRRAEVAGMSFGEGDNRNCGNMRRHPQSGSENGRSRGERTPSRMSAAAITLEGDKVLSRQDALARIGEIQRSRPTSAQDAGYGGVAVNGNEPFVLPEDVERVERHLCPCKNGGVEIRGIIVLLIDSSGLQRAFRKYMK